MCNESSVTHTLNVGTYRIAGNFRGTKISWFSWFNPEHEYFTHELLISWTGSYPGQVWFHQQATTKIFDSIMLNHEIFVPRKLPAIRYLLMWFKLLICCWLAHRPNRGIVSYLLWPLLHVTTMHGKLWTPTFSSCRMLNSAWSLDSGRVNTCWRYDSNSASLDWTLTSCSRS